MKSFPELANSYRSALLYDVIPFWERHSPDREYGGYFTCLDRAGTVYDTDKFIWLQARQVWTFSMLYNRVESRPEWLDLARLGADFLRKYGQAPGGDWYFSLNRSGKPLVQPYNIFSDCFACMAFAQYALASGDNASADLALSTYRSILRRQDNPKGPYNKIVPGSRPIKNFALPMILSNLALEMSHLLSADEINTAAEAAISSVMGQFHDPVTQVIVENIDPGGALVDSFEGRLLNPGHAIEAMWFIMDLAEQRRDQKLVEQAVGSLLVMLDKGWDTEYGGIFYFLDRMGYPSQQLEWDQKLWWVHVETLVALSLGYKLTRRSILLEWLERVHDYTWTHFPDPGYGEWFGYLNRRGEILLTLKGGKWKGCFHIPRGLLRCWKIFETL